MNDQLQKELLPAISKMAEYVSMAQPIIDAQPALQQELAEVKTNFQKSAKARESLSGIVDVLVSNGLVNEAKKAELVEKIASDVKAASELVSQILAARGLVSDTLGSGVSPTAKAASAIKADELESFVNS